MGKLVKNSMRFLWWLQKLMYLWVRSKVFPTQLQEALGLDNEKPVVYALKSRSLTDLLVLDYHCRKEGLPRPQYTISSLIGAKRRGAYLYLTVAGFWQQKRRKRMPSALYRLIGQVTEHEQDVQLVPVSVFWGRNPGKEEKSIINLMFFDDENGGFFQRFFTFFVQGRNVFCNFGKPISLKALANEGLSPEDTTKKLRRVLRVHFRSQRDIVLGPHVYNRADVIHALLCSRRVREVIEQEAQKRNWAMSKVEAQARKYADEVTSRFSHHILRFLDTVLTWLWRKIYDGVEVKNDERLREIAQQYELVYMPSHRSHMDYLLLGYVLYYLGMMPPHTVAGINLNFWPIGPLLRRGGAIFIRRTFRGNRLYGAIVSEFVHYLITTGFPIGFYPEGGRSRTGRLLRPKMGILSMVIQSYRRSPRKPIMLVPVYIGYDKVMEGGSYISELHGKRKKNESVGQLLKARKILRSEFGKAYIGFGEPIELSTFLTAYGIGVLEDDDSTHEQIPLSPIITKLAKDMMVRTNRAAIVNPVGLFATILLATPKKAIGEEDLLATAEQWIELLTVCPYSKDTSICIDRKKLKSELQYAEKLSGLSRFNHPTGDVLYISKEEERLLLAYYRNNIVHLFVLPSLLASFLQYNDEVEEAALLDKCAEMYHLIKEEFFLHWQADELQHALVAYMEAMTELGLLTRAADKKHIRRPDVLKREFSYFKILGNVMTQNVEKYAIFSQLLARYVEYKRVNREAFEKECEMMSQRLSILGGMSDRPLYDVQSFRSFLDSLMQLGHLQFGEDDLILKPSMEQFAQRFKDLLSADVQESLKRIPYLQISPADQKESIIYETLEDRKIRQAGQKGEGAQI